MQIHPEVRKRSPILCPPHWTFERPEDLLTQLTPGPRSSEANPKASRSRGRLAFCVSDTAASSCHWQKPSASALSVFCRYYYYGSSFRTCHGLCRIYKWLWRPEKLRSSNKNWLPSERLPSNCMRNHNLADIARSSHMTHMLSSYRSSLKISS